jgi:glucan 1,6-alpha-glucosidase
MMNFWLEKGVGGFRMDVIDLVGKIPDKEITGNGPKLHNYLQEMNRETFGKYDVLTVGETWGATPEIAKLYSDPKRNELSMVFQFEHIGLDQQPGKEKWDHKSLEIKELKQVLSKWQTALGNEGWNSLFWNNHDLPRIVSRWGNDTTYREESAKMFAILLHLMKGTPYIYQGEEIGMTNYPVNDISEVEDIESVNMYHERLANGYKKEDIIASINFKGRDNARTPIQWDRTENAGFTTGTPWLHVNPNYQEINVEANLEDPNSIFYCYQKLIQLRRDHPIIVWGDYELVTDTPEQVFMYLRYFEGETWGVVANFGEQTKTLQLEHFGQSSDVVISNYERTSVNFQHLELKPYEAFAVKL